MRDLMQRQSEWNEQVSIGDDNHSHISAYSANAIEGKESSQLRSNSISHINADAVSVVTLDTMPNTITFGNDSRSVATIDSGRLTVAIEALMKRKKETLNLIQRAKA
jgi:hypothetical protein